MNRTFGAVAVAAIAAVSLAGCGGSSGGSSSSSSSTTTTTSSSTANAADTACAKVSADLGQLASQGAALLASPSQAGPAVQQLATKMKTDASTGSQQLQTAVNNFITQLNAALQQVQSSKGTPNTTQIENVLTQAAAPIQQACTPASGSTSASSSS